MLQLTPQRSRARAVTVYQSVVYLSAVIGPAIGCAIVDASGFTPIFVITAAGRLAGALVFLAGVRSIARRAVIPSLPETRTT